MKKSKKGSAAIMLVLIAYLLLPLIVTIVYSLFDKWTEIVPRGFSVKSYVEVSDVYSAKSDHLCSADRIDNGDHSSGNVCNDLVFPETG